MKVLFAVSNEEISESIVKRYQKEYKQIISYKNVYYFNAILKEIQKDKTYDRIVISEDLETFTHTQYDQIDKFIFDKLDSISDEASNIRGNDIPIILICSDRRTKSEQMLVKLFGIGVYNAIIGTDRSIEEVCKLINRPRVKKEAKIYYKIDSEDVNYQPENENDVSEMEIQNIIAYYKKLGKNEEKYVESFEKNIAEQYNDTQLRIISKFLPLNVRAVLEEKSPKYQQIMSFNNSVSNSLRYKKKEEKGTSETLLKMKNKPSAMSKPVVIPSSVNLNSTKKLAKIKHTRYIGEEKISENEIPTAQIPKNNIQTNTNMAQTTQKVQTVQNTQMSRTNIQTSQNSKTNRLNSQTSENEQIDKSNIEKNVGEPPKRKRGRPRKNAEVIVQEEQPVKRGRGRPKKNQEITDQENILENVQNDEMILPGIEEVEENTMLPGIDTEENNILPGFEAEQDNVLPGLNTTENNILPGIDEEEESDTSVEQQNNNNISQSYETNNTILPGFDDEEEIAVMPQANSNQDANYNNMNTNSYADSSNYDYVNKYRINNYQQSQNDNYNNETISSEQQEEYIDLSGLLTSDKKMIAFIGTSKNGTSFMVNNIAKLMSSKGINTAILDTTRNRNSYYIYTKNEDELRSVAVNSINNLQSGIAQGIQADSNLTIYTSLPDEQENVGSAGKALETLLKNHSLILIDTDFNTPLNYFRYVQEIYLVQTLDILTIQPLTAFLRELKARNILEENKLRIILNKTVKLRGINEKTIIGGMAYYNDPSMSYMIELFDKNMIKYISIPFDEEVYIKYLEGIVNCDINLKGYSKNFMQILNSLGNMIYPVVAGAKSAYRPPNLDNNGFTPSINNTLDQMKKRY